MMFPEKFGSHRVSLIPTRRHVRHLIASVSANTIACSNPTQELQNYVHYFVRCNAPEETREKFKLVSVCTL